MHIEDENRESATINGGDLTEEEARLFAKGVDAPDDGEDTDVDAEEEEDDGESTEEEEGADDSEEEEEEESDEGADDTAEEARRQQDEAARQQQETQQRAAAPEKPVAPKDFDAEIAKLEQAYADNEIDAVELNRETRKITLEQTRYERQVDDWQRQQDADSAKATDDWNTTAKTWEGEHKAFMANPLRAERMQRALNLLIQSGEPLSNQQLLDRAYKFAAEDSGWKEPPTEDDKTANDKKREAVGKALSDRKQDKPGKTLGDVPAASLDGTSGNNSDFEALDDAPIEEMEDAVAHMKPGTLDRFLRSAEGADSTGREVPARRKSRA